MKCRAEGMGYVEGHPAMRHLCLHCLQFNTGVQVEEQGDVVIAIFGKELGQQVAVIQAALVVPITTTTNINNQPRNRFIIRWQDLFNEERVMIIIFFGAAGLGGVTLLLPVTYDAIFFAHGCKQGLEVALVEEKHVRQNTEQSTMASRGLQQSRTYF